jgi:hypothetical protein
MIHDDVGSGANSIEIGRQMQSTSSQFSIEVEWHSHATEPGQCNVLKNTSVPMLDTRHRNSATDFPFLMDHSYSRGTEFEPCFDHITSLM